MKTCISLAIRAGFSLTGGISYSRCRRFDEGAQTCNFQSGFRVTEQPIVVT